MSRPDIPRSNPELPNYNPMIWKLAADPLNEQGIDNDTRAAAFKDACEWSERDKMQNPRFVRDRNGHTHWAAEYPDVFTFDGQLINGALTHVIVETAVGERIVVRKSDDPGQASPLLLISTGMARQAAQEGKPLEPRPITSEMVEGVVLVPGLPMRLARDPRTDVAPRSQGIISRITGLQMDQAGLVVSYDPQLQRDDLYTDAYDIFNAHLHRIEASKPIGSAALRRIQKHK